MVRAWSRVTGEYSHVFEDRAFIRPHLDPGAVDKRLFIVETEFAYVFHMIERVGNVLYRVLRDARDGKRLGYNQYRV